MADKDSRAQRAQDAEARAQTEGTFADMTPRQGVAPATATDADSRLNALRDADAEERKHMVWLRYDGRKGSQGGLRRTVDEHIDVNYPDEHNEEAVEAYLDQASPSGVLTAKQRQELRDQGIGPDTLQVSAERTYHFLSGQATPVHPDHADWFLKHPGYVFTKVDRPD